jgi:S-disulfanyl-L-cysteine oxidoreductase SoxD
MTLRALPLLLLFAVSLAACGGSSDAVTYPIAPDPAGEALYASNCQVCHANPATGGERQANAPRHDADGHTWHHADRPLVERVLDGVPGGGTMPKFRGNLTETEVASIIAYIKSTWPADLQAWQLEGSQAWEDQLSP